MFASCSTVIFIIYRCWGLDPVKDHWMNKTEEEMIKNFEIRQFQLMQKMEESKLKHQQKMDNQKREESRSSKNQQNTDNQKGDKAN